MNTSLLVTVSDPTHVGLARREAAVLAQQAGLQETEAGKLSIVVTEAARNVLKHARQGSILLREVESPQGRGVEMLAVDAGPGMADVAQCLTDGYSTAGTPGTGLGAITRLATSFDIYSQSGKGTVVMAQVLSGEPAAAHGLEVGAVCLPMTERSPCGDAWTMFQAAHFIQLLVVDGLGHGVPAEKAAAEALRAFHKFAPAPSEELLHSLHGPMRSTRGASLAIVSFDIRAGEIRFTGVGNISGSILSEGKTRSMISHNGTVGHELHRVQEFVYPWPEGSTVVLHSDGLLTRWTTRDYPGLLARHPSITAGILFRDWQRGRDDVTVLVVRRPRP